MSDSYWTELTVNVKAGDPGKALRLRYKVEALLSELANKEGVLKIRWFCSKPVEKVPEKTGG